MRLDQFAMADAVDYWNTKALDYVGYVYGDALASSPKATSGKGGKGLTHSFRKHHSEKTHFMGTILKSLMAPCAMVHACADSVKSSGVNSSLQNPGHLGGVCEPFSCHCSD